MRNFLTFGLVSSNLELRDGFRRLGGFPFPRRRGFDYPEHAPGGEAEGGEGGVGPDVDLDPVLAPFVDADDLRVLAGAQIGGGVDPGLLERRRIVLELNFFLPSDSPLDPPP